MSKEVESFLVLGFILTLEEIKSLSLSKDFCDQEYINKNEKYKSMFAENFAHWLHTDENFVSYSLDSDYNTFVIGFKFNYIVEFNDFMELINKYTVELKKLDINKTLKFVNDIYSF